MSLLTALLEYIEQLEASNEECFRPREDGSPCAQCYERERVIGRLRQIIDANDPKHLHRNPREAIRPV